MNLKGLIFLKILILTLFFPIETYAARKSVSIPNSSVSISWDDSRDSLGKFSQNGDRYGFRKVSPAIVEHTPTGARSASTVLSTLEGSVSRKAVLAGAFGVAKAGAKLAAKAVPYVGAASLAYEAYQAVKSDLESAGYKYDEPSDEFLKYWDNKLCIWDRRGSYPNEIYHEYECTGVDSSTIRAYNRGGKSRSEAEFLMQSKMEAMANKYWPERQKYLDDYFKYNVDTCSFNLNGGHCTVSYNGDIRNAIHFTLKGITFPTSLDSQEFLKIATGSIDSRPTPFVEAQNRPEYKEEVKVPAGTIVTIGPITDKDGKVKQITITFGTAQDGKTNATVSTTERPDVEPNSPIAPPAPDDKPQTPGDNDSLDDNPDSKPDDDPNGNPKDKPGENTGTGSDTGKSEDSDTRKEEKPSEKEQGFLCSMFPNILACAEIGDVSNDEPFKIPAIEDNTTFIPDNFLPTTGQCPAPLNFNVFGFSYEFKYDPLCRFADSIRFMILILSAVIAAKIMFGSSKKE